MLWPEVINNLRSRQLNPCDHLYWKSRGFPERPHDWQERVYGDDTDDDEFNEEEEYSDDESYSSEDESEDDDYEDSDAEYEEHVRRSNVHNPNNEAYWIARGRSKRPDPWRDKNKRVQKNVQLNLQCKIALKKQSSACLQNGLPCPVTI